jgi:hypothetical protein
MGTTMWIWRVNLGCVGLEARPVSASDQRPATNQVTPLPGLVFFTMKKTSGGSMTKLTKQNEEPTQEGIYRTPKRITKIVYKK